MSSFKFGFSHLPCIVTAETRVVMKNVCNQEILVQYPCPSIQLQKTVFGTGTPKFKTRPINPLPGD